MIAAVIGCKKIVIYFFFKGVAIDVFDVQESLHLPIFVTV